MKRLPAQSSPGPDGIPYYVWKYAKASSSTLSTIYTTCLINQRTPDSWKKSNTILIFKKGEKVLPAIGNQYLCSQLSTKSMLPYWQGGLQPGPSMRKRSPTPRRAFSLLRAVWSIPSSYKVSLRTVREGKGMPELSGWILRMPLGQFHTIPCGR